MATSTLAPEVLIRAEPAHVRWAFPWWMAALLPVLLIAAPLAYASYRAFPLYDDGWLALLIREHGQNAAWSTMPDRPLYAVVMTALFLPESVEKIGFVAVTFALWIAFALVAGWLWRTLSPDLARYAPVASALVIAPIVATCQLTTVVTSLQIIPPLLVFCAIILLLNYVADGRTWRNAVAAALVACGTLFSEYAVPASAAGIVLLLRPLLFERNAEKRKRARLAVLTLGAVCLISYVVYFKLADASFRPSVSPFAATDTVKRNPLSIVTNLANGTWRSVVGAYGSGLGKVAIHWDSKSTLVAAGFSIPLIFALLFSCRGRTKRDEPSVYDSLFPLLAVLAGLLPVALMNRSTFMVGFGSRFLIPILPVAAAATLSIVFSITRPAARSIAVAAVGLIGAYSTLITVNTVLQDQSLAAEIGRTLRPQLSTAGGNTVAVVNRQGIDYEMTATASAAWSTDQGRKFWLYDEATARKVLGSRQSCIQPLTLSLNQRHVSRSGPIDVLLWVETVDTKIVAVEPYCRQPKL